MDSNDMHACQSLLFVFLIYPWICLYQANIYNVRKSLATDIGRGFAERACRYTGITKGSQSVSISPNLIEV